MTSYFEKVKKMIQIKMEYKNTFNIKNMDPNLLGQIS